MSQIIVVGGGLSGTSAANTIIQSGGKVLLLDKSAFLGGNSVQATSGINASGTLIQKSQDIDDNVELFKKDIYLSASKGENENEYPLGTVLAEDSVSAQEWLTDQFKLELTKVGRMGGHSRHRCHRGPEKFPGMTITTRLINEVESYVDKGNVKILTKANVTSLIQQDNQVMGVTYEKDNKELKAYGPVILCTGGYGADQTSNSLLFKYRNDVKDLPTTNAKHCTGDGIKMSMNIGGIGKDLEYVQVHPTGLVNPDKPDEKKKTLAAEALRGSGGLLLTGEGKRFCDELGRRDYVTGEMGKNNGPFRLVLNSKAASEIGRHCVHYSGKNLMIHYKSGDELASDMKISSDVLQNTFDEQNKIAEKKSCPQGKKYFDNAPFVMNDEYYVCLVVPVVHYTMGGISVSTKSEVMSENGAIPGLQAAGEVMGGTHGKNRLGGNSLLDCVVFGRIAGKEAVKQHYNIMTSVNEFDNRSIVKIKPSKPDVKKLTPIETKVKAATSGPKIQTQDEVSKHNNENDCWVVVNGDVLNLTKFLDDHPGGINAMVNLIRASLAQVIGDNANQGLNIHLTTNKQNKKEIQVLIGSYYYQLLIGVRKIEIKDLKAANNNDKSLIIHVKTNRILYNCAGYNESHTMFVVPSRYIKNKKINNDEGLVCLNSWGECDKDKYVRIFDDQINKKNIYEAYEISIDKISNKQNVGWKNIADWNTVIV